MARSHTNPAKKQSVSPVQRRRKWAAHALHRAHDQGGMTVLIDGLAGMGKTFLLRELRTAALEDGRWPLTVVRADKFEVGEPYSFIERIVAASQVADWYFEPGSLTDPIAVARECIQRLIGEGVSSGRVFLIDDAQWIDAESHRVLRYLIPRIARRNMLLAFGTRSPHEHGSIGEFLTELVDDSHLDLHLHLEPLSAQEVSALIAERYGAVVGTPVAQQMVDETGGSFLEIDSILSRMTTSEIEQLQLRWHSTIRAETRFNGPLLKQYKELNRPTRATVELISAAGHGLTVEQIHAAASILGEPVHVDDAIAGGVLSVSQTDGTVAAHHALLAEAIVGSLTSDRAREIYLALAAVTEGFRSLRHRLMGVSEWTQHLHDEVLEYVAVAAAERRFGSASDVLRAALTIVTEPGVRIDLIETLVLLHLRARTAYLVLDFLDELQQAPPNLLRQLLVQVLSAYRVGSELSAAAVREVFTTTPKTTDERTMLAFYAFMVVLLSMRRSDTSAVPGLIEHAKKLVADAPRSRSELADQRLGWMVERDGRLLLLDCYQMVQLQQREQFDQLQTFLPKLLRRIENAENTPIKVDALVTIAGAHVATGRVDLAHATAEQGVEMLEQVGEPWAAGTARVILGHCMILRGELRGVVELMDLTEAVAHSSLDVETRSSWASLRLMVAAITGNDDAELYLDAARRHSEIGWEGYSPDLGVIAECELARVRGEAEAVLELTAEDSVGKFRSTQRGFLTYRALAMIETGLLPEAQALISRLAKWRGTRWHEYWGTLDWLSARLAQALGDAETAKWHFESAVRRDEYPLSHGLALADFGRFQAELGDKGGSRRALGSAVAVLERIGADGYLARIQAEQDDTHDASSNDEERAAERARMLPLLTDRERQVAEQLAKGRSNPQIADSLVVSVATVRSHISNILRKLQLSSRADVARILSDRPRSD